MEDDRGQITPLIALLVAFAAAAMVVLAALGERATGHARAETAAEAAALAAAASGDPVQADRVAAANGAGVVSVDMGPPVVVTVDLGGIRATAAADRLPVVPGPSD